MKLLPVTFSKTLISPTALEHTIATIPVLLLGWFMAANPDEREACILLQNFYWPLIFSIIHWNDLIDLNTYAQRCYHLLINFLCYMLPINILIYTVYPSIISQGLFFCTKSGRSFKGQRLFEEENIPSLPSAPWSDGWTQNINFGLSGPFLRTVRLLSWWMKTLYFGSNRQIMELTEGKVYFPPQISAVP